MRRRTRRVGLSGVAMRVTAYVGEADVPACGIAHFGWTEDALRPRVAALTWGSYTNTYIRKETLIEIVSHLPLIG